MPLFCVKISPIRFFHGARARARALIEAIKGKEAMDYAELEVKSECRHHRNGWKILRNTGPAPKKSAANKPNRV